MNENERIVKLPPQCTWCEHFRYKKGAEKIYRCKHNCECSNDIFELFENCHRLDWKYGVIDVSERSDEMGWKRAEHFEKKCPKELHNKKMYIKRLEYKVQKFKEENEKLQKENNDYEKQFRIINEKLDEYIKTADTYRIPISSLKPGDELGYFNGVYQYMKKLKKDIGGIFK